MVSLMSLRAAAVGRRETEEEEEAEVEEETEVEEEAEAEEGVLLML